MQHVIIYMCQPYCWPVCLSIIQSLISNINLLCHQSESMVKYCYWVRLWDRCRAQKNHEAKGTAAFPKDRVHTCCSSCLPPLIPSALLKLVFTVIFSFGKQYPSSYLLFTKSSVTSLLYAKIYAIKKGQIFTFTSELILEKS